MDITKSLGIGGKSAPVGPPMPAHIPAMTAPVPTSPAHVAVHLGTIHAPNGAFALASVEDIDVRWISSTQAAGGDGFCVDVKGADAAELVSSHNNFQILTLADGTVRVKTGNIGVTKVVEDQIQKRIRREGSTATTARAAFGSSSLSCRDAVRAVNAAMVEGPDRPKMIAIVGEKLEVIGIKDAQGNITEITLKVAR